MLTVDVGGGESLLLLPERAAYVPRHGALLVADAHFGKAVSFRRLGVPVPRGTTSETLAVLDALLERTGAQRIVFLGDFLHSARAHAPSTLGALARWRLCHRGVRLTLVRGNHDQRAGDPPGGLGIDIVDEPFRLGGLALRHHPGADTAGYVLAGHLHPCVTVRGRARQALRLPCFHLGAQCGVLPAFGAFTGMHPIDAAPDDRVFVAGPDRVVELPRPNQ